MLRWFKRRRHKSDEYFKAKFREPMSSDAFNILNEACHIRHEYPDLSGPELVRLVYWGASGSKGD